MREKPSDLEGIFWHEWWGKTHVHIFHLTVITLLKITNNTKISFSNQKISLASYFQKFGKSKNFIFGLFYTKFAYCAMYIYVPKSHTVHVRKEKTHQWWCVAISRIFYMLCVRAQFAQWARNKKIRQINVIIFFLKWKTCQTITKWRVKPNTWHFAG